MRDLRNFLRNIIFKIYFAFSRVMLRFLNKRGTSWFSYLFNSIVWRDPSKLQRKSTEAYEVNLYAKILSSLMDRPINNPAVIQNDLLENIIIKKMERDIYLSADETKRLTLDYSIRLEPEFLAELQTVDIKAGLGNNSQPEVSVIYPFRDRTVDRLKLSIQSLLKYSSVPLEVIAVDYGSKAEFSEDIKTFCENNNVVLVRTETEGMPWSRAQALNLGLKTAKTRYVVTTDIDMVFADDIIGQSLAKYKPNSKLHCKPLWLKKDGLRESAWLGDKYQLGGYMFTEKSTLDQYGYFNNKIFYWGIEDIELNTRLNIKGIETIWIEEASKMYHMWHTPSYGDFDNRPLSSWFDSNLILMHTLLDENTSDKHIDAVDVLKLEDRPIIQKLSESQPLAFEVINFMNDLKSIVEFGEKNKFVQLNLGSRVTDMTSVSIKKNLGYIDNFFKQRGAEIAVLKNKNFDFFYLSLPLLKLIGLIDFYISEDYSVVYLLFK